jgi:hypothetical protein
LGFTPTLRQSGVVTLIVGLSPKALPISILRAFLTPFLAENSPLTVATPLWPNVGVKPNTPKVGVLESSGTTECLEFDRRAQNTSHWGIFGVIGKVLKRRYQKWPRIGHLDICSSSYGQKKGRESNWQFDSRPLKSRESTRS